MCLTLRRRMRPMPMPTAMPSKRLVLVAALLATVAAYLILPEAPAILGAAVGLTPLGAFTAGYMGSSIGAKLPALFGRVNGVR